MTREEAVKMLEAKLECMTRDVSGIDDDCNRKLCNECHLCYDQGNMGEQKEYLRMSIEALKQEPCEDTISRQTLIERINNAEEIFKSDNMESIASDDGDPFVDGVLSGVFNIRQMVIQAPPVIPQPKTGHWVNEILPLPLSDGSKECVRCSKCGLHYDNPSYYCPNCGDKKSRK